MPAKAGKHQFAGAAAPLSVSGFACAANSTPQWEGFALPPPIGRLPPPNACHQEEGGPEASNGALWLA